MGDENEISVLLNEEWMHENLKGSLFDEEAYNKVRYDEDGKEYHLVVSVRRGQPK